MENMCKIQQKLQPLLDSKDPTQKAIGLLAMLVDDRFQQTQQTLSGHTIQLEDINTRIKRLETREDCPIKLDNKVTQLDKDLKVVRFFSTNWKLFFILILGIIAIIELLSSGVISINKVSNIRTIFGL